MENVNGHVKFQNHYGRVHVQLSGNCKMWRSDTISEDGGWLSADVFVDIVEQKWHANLKVANLFVPVSWTLQTNTKTFLFQSEVVKFVHVPRLLVAFFLLQLFERILEIPIMWSKGRATGEVLL